MAKLAKTHDCVKKVNKENACSLKVDKNLLFFQIEALFANSNLLIDWCEDLLNQGQKPDSWDHHDIDLISYQADKISKLMQLSACNVFQDHELEVAWNQAKDSLHKARVLLNKYNIYLQRGEQCQ